MDEDKPQNRSQGKGRHIIIIITTMTIMTKTIITIQSTLATCGFAFRRFDYLLMPSGPAATSPSPPDSLLLASDVDLNDLPALQ
jgi:hypothetical protein